MPKESPKFKEAHWRGEIRPKNDGGVIWSSGDFTLEGWSLPNFSCGHSTPHSTWLAGHLGQPGHTGESVNVKIFTSLGQRRSSSPASLSMIILVGTQDTARWKNDKIHCRSGRLGQHSYLLPPLSDHSPHSHFHSFSTSFTRFDIIWPKFSFPKRF